MNASFAASLGAVLALAATMAPTAQARHASQECRGGLPVLTLLEGGGYAVNAYRLDCGKGAARSALVIPDGAAATGDGVACSLGREPFDLTSDMVDASGIRAGAGDTVLCKAAQPVAQRKSRRRKPPPKRYVTLRPSDAAPLPGGTGCEVSNETLSGSFMLTGTEVDVTVAAILVDCGASAGSALIVPRGATTAVAPIIKGVRLSCPADRLGIPNRPAGRSGNQVVVADDQIANCKASLGGRHRETASFDLTLGGVEPLGCGDSESKCVFVTSTSGNGAFGGLAAADDECNTLAASADLPAATRPGSRTMPPAPARASPGRRCRTRWSTKPRSPTTGPISRPAMPISPRVSTTSSTSTRTGTDSPTSFGRAHGQTVATFRARTAAIGRKEAAA